MNNDPSRPAAEAPEKNRKNSFWRRMLGVVTRSWGWKLTSLVLAVCLWGMLISQDSALPRDKIVENVRVTVTNKNTLNNNGFIVVSGLEDVDEVDLRVRVPQKNYSAVTAANFTARLDLSQIREDGEQTLKVTASSSNTAQYGTVLEVLSPDVTVQVEAYDEKSPVPVEVRLSGEVPENYYAGALTRTADTVTVSGPKSKVDQIARCVVVWDQSALSPERLPNTASLPFAFEDEAGNPVDGENITVTGSQGAVLPRIAVSQEVYYKARVPVDTDSLYTGAPAEGYAVSSVRVTPEAITIAGSREAVAQYLEEGSAFYTYEQLNIDGQSRTVSGFLTLRSPQNLDYISSGAVQVIVSILPEEFVNAAQTETGETP